MNPPSEPLLNDGLDGEAAKRVLKYVQAHKEKKDPIVGVYCGYAPIELMQAMGLVPTILCAFSKNPIPTAETVLPANLCPLIKSSYGFILEGTCPFFSMSDAIIAETTCDGKKKMFEMISDIKPMFVMDLPQLPDEPEAADNWTVMIGKLLKFLETTFRKIVSDNAIETAIRQSNRKNRMVRELLGFAALDPPVISWKEMYDVSFIALPSTADEIMPLLEKLNSRLKKRVEDGVYIGKKNAPRVLVTGCPLGGDALKIFKVIEENGGVVVAVDSCTGMKTFMGDIEENTGNPIRAIAERYLKIPCSCMTPNQRRLNALSDMIAKFKPDAVIDVVLQACHSYSVESYKIGKHIETVHGLPFLKIETDYSDSDMGQLQTRIGALLESI